MGRYRDRRAGFRDYHLRAGEGSVGYERDFRERLGQADYGADYRATADRWNPHGGYGGGNPRGAGPGPSRSPDFAGEREMLSNGYSRRLRGGWQWGYDGDYQGGGYMGGDRDYLRNRASAAYEQDYMRPGPTYGPRGSTFSPGGYGW